MCFWEWSAKWFFGVKWEFVIILCDTSGETKWGENRKFLTGGEKKGKKIGSGNVIRLISPFPLFLLGGAILQIVTFDIHIFFFFALKSKYKRREIPTGGIFFLNISQLRKIEIFSVRNINYQTANFYANITGTERKLNKDSFHSLNITIQRK